GPRSRAAAGRDGRGVGRVPGLRARAIADESAADARTDGGEAGTRWQSDLVLAFGAGIWDGCGHSTARRVAGLPHGERASADPTGGAGYGGWHSRRGHE